MRRLLLAILAVLVGAFFAAGSAEARVYSLRPTQDIAYPDPDQVFAAPKVAIDGNSAIAILDRAGARDALLFQRGSSGWTQVRTLFSVPASSQLRNELAMDNNIAAIMLDATLRIFERNPATNQWSESDTAGTPQPAGSIAISGSRILAGRRGCNYDADVHEKSVSSGVWRIRGRISGAIGACNNHGAELDIDGNTALVRNPNEEARVYRVSPNGTDWPQVASFGPAPRDSFGLGPLSLNGHLAFATGGAVYRENTANDWSFLEQLAPLDYANGAGVGFAHARAGVLLTQTQYSDFREDAHVYVYAPVPEAADHYEHAAVLYTPGYAYSSDVSNGTVVAASVDQFSGERFISFFALPAPVHAPDAYANDFTTHDPALWQQTTGSQFARVASGSNFVYRQSSLAGDAQAVFTQSDWPVQQSIEADITPTAVDGADRWVGLAARYADANNHYYVTLRSSNRIELKRKVNGAFVTLAQATLPFSLNTLRHVKLIVNDDQLRVDVDGVQRLGARDRSLTRGNVALMTYRARADFDNVYASPTAPFNLSYKDFRDIDFNGRIFTFMGGRWDYDETPGSSDLVFSQFNTDGDARAFIGTPTDDQSVAARVRLDAYGTSAAGAWFGLLARYVDARSHYYLTARSTNRLEIRRKVNNVNTVLASVPFTPVAGRFYDLKLTVLGDELHAYLDGVLVAQAHDSQIASGQYGLATYRAAASFQNFIVDQP